MNARMFLNQNGCIHQSRLPLCMSGCQGTMNRLANRTLSSIRKCTRKNIPGKKDCTISGTFLTEQRFMKLTSALEQEQEANQKRLQDLALMMRRTDEQESDVRTFIREIRKYAAIQELDEAALNRLISKILVGEVQKIDGQKFQQVKIIYTFLATSIKFPLAYR